LIVASITNAKKLANSLASFGICFGIFPVSSRKWVMLDIYILNIVGSMIVPAILYNGWCYEFSEDITFRQRLLIHCTMVFLFKRIKIGI